MSKFKLPAKIRNMNKPMSVNELGKKLGVNMDPNKLIESHNTVMNWDRETVIDTFLLSLDDDRFHEVMEFHRKRLLEVAYKNPNTESSKRFVEQFTAPILKVEMFTLSMICKLGVVNEDKEIMDMIDNYKNDDRDTLTDVLRIIGMVRDDNELMDSMLSLENKIDWNS
jgi:hypothetical protein